MSTGLSEMYDDVLEELPIDPDGILKFKLPKKLHQRVAALVAKDNAEKLTDGENLELQKFLVLEATVRALKAKALVAKRKAR